MKIEGWLQGQYVEELRSCWQEIQAAGGVIVELADVRFVDRRGKALLAAMHSRGVRIRAGDPLCAALRDEIVARCERTPSARARYRLKRASVCGLFN